SPFHGRNLSSPESVRHEQPDSRGKAQSLPLCSPLLLPTNLLECGAQVGQAQTRHSLFPEPPRRKRNRCTTASATSSWQHSSIAVTEEDDLRRLTGNGSPMVLMRTSAKRLSVSGPSSQSEAAVIRFVFQQEVRNADDPVHGKIPGTSRCGNSIRSGHR